MLISFPEANDRLQMYSFARPMRRNPKTLHLNDKETHNVANFKKQFREKLREIDICSLSRVHMSADTTQRRLFDSSALNYFPQTFLIARPNCCFSFPHQPPTSKQRETHTHTSFHLPEERPSSCHPAEVWFTSVCHHHCRPQTKVCVCMCVQIPWCSSQRGVCLFMVAAS